MSVTARTRNALGAAAIVAVALWSRGLGHPAEAQDEVSVYLPFAGRAIRLEDLPTPAPGEPTIPPLQPTPRPSPSPTWTSVPVPDTATPLPTWTPEPTEAPDPVVVRGRIVFDGDPLPPGYGGVGGPQIELRRCASDDGEPCPLADWEGIAHAVTEDEGAFEFRSAPALEAGQLYQVWWVNDDNERVQGDSRFLHRWWSRPIDTLAPGDEVDVGTFDVTDLKYKSICHDCGQSLPITFEWTARRNRSEKYHWSLFRGCGNVDNREQAYRTRSLGHAKEYTLESPPPGFRLNEKYCWYIFIDDGDNGTGWPFFDWRVTFLPTP